MIIFDEKEYALKILKSGFKDFMSFRDLLILAKYWRYEGRSSYQVRKDMIDFCRKYNPSFNNIMFRDRMDKILRYSKKSKLRTWEDILVFQQEIDAIRSIKDYKSEKTLFCMLVVSKIFRSKNSNKFYVNASFGKMLTLAKVNGSKQDRMALLKKLNDSGLIRTTLGGSFEIMFAIVDGKTVATTVENIEKVLTFYPVYCSECGERLKKKLPKHTFCKECYKEYRKNEVRKNVEKHRSK